MALRSRVLWNLYETISFAQRIHFEQPRKAIPHNEPTQSATCLLPMPRSHATRAGRTPYKSIVYLFDFLK